MDRVSGDEQLADIAGRAWIAMSNDDRESFAFSIVFGKSSSQSNRSIASKFARNVLSETDNTRPDPKDSSIRRIRNRSSQRGVGYQIESEKVSVLGGKGSSTLCAVGTTRKKLTP